MGKKLIAIICTGVLSLLLGVVIAVQMGSIGGQDQGGLVPYSKVKEYETAITAARAEKEAAIEELADLRERLSEIEGDIASEDAVINAMLKEMERYRLYAGLTDVEGPGITVTIADPPPVDALIDDTSVITYNYEQLVILINKLKEAGAEAICINGHRVVQTTEISLAGSNININGSATAPPYTIDAVGNPSTLENAITIRGGIIESLKKDYNLTVSIEKKEKLVLPRFSGTVSFKYAETVSPDDNSDDAADTEGGEADEE